MLKTASIEENVWIWAEKDAQPHNFIQKWEKNDQLVNESTGKGRGIKFSIKIRCR
jgi:hypothetical protein